MFFTLKNRNFSLQTSPSIIEKFSYFLTIPPLPLVSNKGEVSPISFSFGRI